MCHRATGRFSAVRFGRLLFDALPLPLAASNPLGAGWQLDSTIGLLPARATAPPTLGRIDARRNSFECVPAHRRFESPSGSHTAAGVKRERRHIHTQGGALLAPTKVRRQDYTS
jgi:hypothetical protein